jgi:predicted DNA-binding protein
MKNSIINVRINESIKEELETISIQNDKPISVIVRNIIENYLENDESVNEDVKLLQSLSFNELIYWVMDKYRDSEVNECSTLYEQHMNTILQMENNTFFDEYILIEFRKVYKELNEFVLNQNYFDIDFKFCTEQNGFDYQKLQYFMQILRYDDDDDKILHIK